METIKLTNGELGIKYYNSNMVVYYNDESAHYDFDGDRDFTTEENIDSFIESKLVDELGMIITAEDNKKLHYELHNYFYAHSSEIVS